MTTGERPPGTPPVSGPWGRLTLVLLFLPVLGLLALVGSRLVLSEGWSPGGSAIAGPGIFTSGRLVQPSFRSAPEFALRLYTGGEIRIGDLRGKPVVVNFWASWCPPCRQEAPLLERMAKEYRERGVVFVGVNVWDNDEDARRFLQEFGVSFPTGPDPRGQISIDYGVTGLPETFFIDRQGQVTHKWLGPVPEDRFRGLIEEIVG